VQASARAGVARELFAPLGPTYDRFARLLSLGQDPGWRRFLVSRVRVGPGDVVLDVATGTGAVAIELVRRYGCTVVALDQSPEMLAAARHRLQQAGLTGRVRLIEGRAERLPFETGSFDALTFTYLLRYVEDPAATLCELARVIRPGATAAMLEFAVPGRPWRRLWDLYVGTCLPAAGRAIGRGWDDVGGFLGDSIRDFSARMPLAALVGAWEEAGFGHVQARRMSFGGAVVVWGTRRG
jgi:demethylmenaquinone methyltransferase/2-methoxy-6-polyprenyl-1,4-benzoquinol methylase